MAKTGEKACVLEINFTNEKKKKGKTELRMLIKQYKKPLRKYDDVQCVIQASF